MAPAPIHFALPKIHLPFKKKETVVEPVVAPTPETEDLTNKTLSQLIDDKLAQFGGNEFLVVKINKQGLLLFCGIILFAIWLSPFVRIGQQKISSGEWSVKSIKLPVIHMPALPFAKKPMPAASPMPSAIPESATPSAAIRVRMGSDASASAEMVRQLLTNAGFNQLDVVVDTTVDPNQVLIATHSGSLDLGQRLTTLFEKQYKTSSSSATLTEDSNFAASILVGKNALRKK